MTAPANIRERFLRNRENFTQLMGQERTDFFMDVLSNAVVVMLREVPPPEAWTAAFEFRNQMMVEANLLPQQPYPASLYIVPGLESATLALQGPFEDTNGRNYAFGATVLRTTDARLGVNSFAMIPADDIHSAELFYLADPSQIRDRNGDRETAHYALNWATVAAAYLSLPGVERSETPAPARLNKQRAQKGKPPIAMRCEIRLNRSIMPRTMGGTHNSPVPHWRRGHVRRLPTGRIAMVRPHPVLGGKLPSIVTVKT